MMPIELADLPLLVDNRRHSLELWLPIALGYKKYTRSMDVTSGQLNVHLRPELLSHPRKTPLWPRIPKFQVRVTRNASFALTQLPCVGAIAHKKTTMGNPSWLHDEGMHAPNLVQKGLTLLDILASYILKLSVRGLVRRSQGA